MFQGGAPCGQGKHHGCYGSPCDNFPVHRMFDKGITIHQGQAPVLNYIDHLIELVKEEKVGLESFIPNVDLIEIYFLELY